MTTLVLCRVSSARLDRPLSLRPHDVAPMCVWHAGTGDGDVFEVVVKMCLFQRIRFTSGGGARTIHQTSNGSRARRRSRTAGLLNSTSGVGEPVSTPRGCQTSDRVLASQGREDQPCGFDRRSGVTHRGSSAHIAMRCARHRSAEERALRRCNSPKKAIDFPLSG